MFGFWFWLAISYTSFAVFVVLIMRSADKAREQIKRERHNAR